MCIAKQELAGGHMKKISGRIMPAIAVLTSGMTDPGCFVLAAKS